MASVSFVHTASSIGLEVQAPVRQEKIFKYSKQSWGEKALQLFMTGYYLK